MILVVDGAIVNCRCGQKPWSNKDLTSQFPTRQCCEYFVESGEGNFTESNSICQIENEFIYKRFHSCCVSLIRNAYCFQQKLNTFPSSSATSDNSNNNNDDNDSNENHQPVRDPWARYEKLFGGFSFLG